MRSHSAIKLGEFVTSSSVISALELSSDPVPELHRRQRVQTIGCQRLSRLHGLGEDAES